MPEISRFYGIVIRMYFGDHPPPHFHAEYSGHFAVVEIDTLSIISGSLPPRAMGLVTEWALMHKAELLDRWEEAEKLQPISRIDPLP